MSGEVLLHPRLCHTPQDIAAIQNALGCIAVLTRQNGPPRVRLVPLQSKSQISPGSQGPAGSARWFSAAAPPGDRPTPHSSRSPGPFSIPRAAHQPPGEKP